MSRALVLLADGFEEIECATVVDVLRRGEVEVLLAGIDGNREYRGSRGMLFVPDIAFDQAQGEWDAVVLPGGRGGAERLRDHEGVQELLVAQRARGGVLAAICAAPLALDAAGVLPENGYTCYPGLEDELGTSGWQGREVVEAHDVITSQAAGTAMHWALYLLRELQGDAVARRVTGELRYVAED